MSGKSRYFEPLPSEVLIAVGDWLSPPPPTARIDNRARSIGKMWFQNLNQTITDKIPELREHFDSDLQAIDPIGLFLKLCAALHAKANLLNCDITMPLDLNPAEVISWECAHLNELIINMTKS